MTKKGTQTLKWNFRQLAKDDRLHPNRRLLAVLLLGVLEGHEEFWELIREQYGAASKVRWTENSETFKEQKPTDTLNQEASQALKQLFEQFGGEDGKPDGDSGSASESSGS